MTRALAATITDANGRPREGLLVLFQAPEGIADAAATTDASGVFRVELEPEQTYRVSVENAVIVDAQLLPAGTVIAVTAPAGEGPVPLAEVGIATVDASRPALLDTIEALTTRIEALEAEVQALQPAPEPEPAPEGGD